MASTPSSSAESDGLPWHGDFAGNATDGILLLIGGLLTLCAATAGVAPHASTANSSSAREACTAMHIRRTDKQKGKRKEDTCPLRPFD